ncbi:hypothetical protein EDB87DRAFT_1577500 [Lactarius vividus]|nr:hypothetical protein EDB87DRAFT_1577500 [Lactarius vividus]
MTKTFAQKEELLMARALKRAQHAEARRVKAEEHKETGNAHFRKGGYREAIAEYEVVIKIHGPTATYLSNMAAAWLTLETHARDLQLTTAAVDFATVLEQIPGSTETKKALDELLILMKERNEEDEAMDSEYCRPRVNVDLKVELVSVSNSRDFNHEGNGVPCRSYNHDGCKQGPECKFLHVPDHKNVRDRLRVFLSTFRLRRETLTLDADQWTQHLSALLTRGLQSWWWECEAKRAEARDMSRWPFCRQNPAVLPLMFALVDNRVAWKPAQAAKLEDAYVWKDSIMMLKGFGDATDDLGMVNWDGQDNFAERVARVNRGFTEIEIQPEQVGQYQDIWGHDDDACREVLVGNFGKCSD